MMTPPRGTRGQNAASCEVRVGWGLGAPQREDCTQEVNSSRIRCAHLGNATFCAPLGVSLGSPWQPSMEPQCPPVVAPGTPCLRLPSREAQKASPQEPLAPISHLYIVIHMKEGLVLIQSHLDGEV